MKLSSGRRRAYHVFIYIYSILECALQRQLVLQTIWKKQHTKSIVIIRFHISPKTLADTDCLTLRLSLLDYFGQMPTEIINKKSNVENILLPERIQFLPFSCSVCNSSLYFNWLLKRFPEVFPRVFKRRFFLSSLLVLFQLYWLLPNFGNLVRGRVIMTFARIFYDTISISNKILGCCWT